VANARSLFNAVGRLRRSQSGSAAVELALVLPILLLLIIGVVDYGRAFYTSITVANAARAGAEYGAQGPATSVDTAGMKTFAQGDGQDAGTLTLSAQTYCECAGAVQVCTSTCPGGIAPDVFVEVTATKAVSMFFDYPGLPDTLTIVRKATFRSQ